MVGVDVFPGAGVERFQPISVEYRSSRASAGSSGGVATFCIYSTLFVDSTALLVRNVLPTTAAIRTREARFSFYSCPIHGGERRSAPGPSAAGLPANPPMTQPSSPGHCHLRCNSACSRHTLVVELAVGAEQIQRRMSPIPGRFEGARSTTAQAPTGSAARRATAS